MRLVAALSFTALYCLGCSPVTSAETSDADVGSTADSAVGAVDAAAPDGMSIPQGDLGGACFPNSTCNGALVCNPEKICAVECVPGNIVYLNKEGGTYTSGPDDSRTNTSSIPTATVTVSSRTITSTQWNQLLLDVRMKLGAYDVALVDVDPGNVPHLEIVITDTTGSDFGVQGALGISPGCSDDFSLIGFIFGGPSGGLTLSTRVASRIGLTMGLSYTVEGGDLMTWDLQTIGTTFTNTSLNCGQSTATDCRCKQSETQQNSHTEMLAKLGARVCN